MGDAETDSLNPADVRRSAMNLLARREHSRRELHDKLLTRYPSASGVISDEIDRLTEEHLQSDERFAESFVRQRILRGAGPRRLRQEMSQRGISESELARALEATAPDWYQLAEQTYAKKFGETQPTDVKEKARRVRFMEYRGFSREHYEHLFD